MWYFVTRIPRHWNSETLSSKIFEVNVVNDPKKLIGMVPVCALLEIGEPTRYVTCTFFQALGTMLMEIIHPFPKLCVWQISGSFFPMLMIRFPRVW